MPKLYNFTRLIDKYSVEITLIKQTEGGYDDYGVYMPGGNTTETIKGAVAPYGMYGNMYDSVNENHDGGAYTEKDRELFVKAPIEDALLSAKIQYKGCEYRIESLRDYGEYADAYIYMLKYVRNLT